MHQLWKKVFSKRPFRLIPKNMIQQLNRIKPVSRQDKIHLKILTFYRIFAIFMIMLHCWIKFHGHCLQYSQILNVDCAKLLRFCYILESRQRRFNNGLFTILYLKLTKVQLKYKVFTILHLCIRSIRFSWWLYLCLSIVFVFVFCPMGSHFVLVF